MGMPQQDQNPHAQGEQPFTSLPVERGLLGALLYDPERLAEVDLVGADFGGLGHGAIYDAMAALKRNGHDVNELAVSQYLHELGQLRDVGGPATLMHMTGKALQSITRRLDHQVPLTAVKDLVVKVKDLSLRRQAHAETMRVQALLRDMGQSAEEVILTASGSLATLSGAGLGGIRTAAAIVQEEMQRIDAIQDGDESNVQYLLTGVRLWDELLGGAPRGFVTVLGAHASVGKSAVIASMALSMACGSPTRKPEACAIFSLEDKGGWLGRRYLAEYSGLAIRQMMKKGLTEDQRFNLYKTAEGLVGPLERILVDDRRRLTVQRVAAKMRQLHAQRGIRVFFVDHMLELLDKKSSAARDLAVADILETLRDVAIDLDVAVILACHLRDLENPNADARYCRPKLQDFAGGQFVGRMARIAVGLWLPPPPPEPDMGKLKPPKEPTRFAKNTTPEEKDAARAKYEAELAVFNMEWSRKHSAWKAQCERLADSLICTVIKATEGGAGFDFLLQRTRHAGLIDPNGGSVDVGELGYTRAPSRRR